MKNATWVAYAAKTLVVRPWDLAKIHSFPLSYSSIHAKFNPPLYTCRKQTLSTSSSATSSTWPASSYSRVPGILGPTYGSHLSSSIHLLLPSLLTANPN
ncbi:hypothetical protein BDQ12DRAFT_687999 [Crucibulum laeve]|uniref:Uncharacterized protein n=1 Tax=Crucibulum laeve TaxID=68775 RepID=A0A5C3LQZ6_9AGAR|nr:hypothetical protein BDQ12DRAFT_687999 [Crucibulum laeve]